MLYVPPANPTPHQVRFIQATTDGEAKMFSRELEIESPEVQENTQLWANAREATGPPRRETIDVGDIETGNLNIQEKSNLLHNVALSA